MNILRVFLTCALIFEQVVFPLSGLFAQSNDKSFTQDLQGPSGDEGGPILEDQG